MADMFDLAVYIVGMCLERSCDPIEEGDTAVRKLFLSSNETEELYTGIILASRFRLAAPERLARVRKRVESTPEFSAVLYPGV